MITFAAAETSPSAITAASHINIPSLIFSSDEDGVTPPATKQGPMYGSLASYCKSGAYFLEITVRSGMILVFRLIKV